MNWESATLKTERALAPLVPWRHPILLIFVLVQTWSLRSDIDWALLGTGSRHLFSAQPLSAYASTSGLQAGPPTLVLVGGLRALPGNAGLWMAHLLIALIGWLLIYLVERWTVPGVTWRSAPTRAGLYTLLVGLFVLEPWGWLAGATPHPEDAMAILCFALALRAISHRRENVGAVLVGLAIAWKPWAIAALPMVLGLPRRFRAAAIAVIIPLACWLPFVLGDPATLSTVGHGFSIMIDSPLRILGFRGAQMPDWWRTAELAGTVVAALLAALRRDWRVAFAAGCAARLLLDPAGFDYYFAGLVMVTAVTERMTGRLPWRTVLLQTTVGFFSYGTPLWLLAYLRFGALLAVMTSWVVPSRRQLPSPLRPAPQTSVVLGRKAPVTERNTAPVGKPVTQPAPVGRSQKKVATAAGGSARYPSCR